VTISVDRRQVLAYRVAAQQLDRPGVDVPALAVLDIGVQDTPYGSAALAVAARADGPVDESVLGLVWTVRGAPHLHRRAELPALAGALWPLSDADATARINTNQIRDGARLGLAAFTATAQALRDVVTAPMPKGEVSAAVSARVPEPLTYWCRACDARHVSGSVFQAAGVHGGVQLDLSRDGTWLAPVDGWPGVPTAPVGTADLVTAYLRLLGPATAAETAKFLGTTQAAARPAWPDDLVEVTVEGRRTWLPADRVDAVRGAPEPRFVRLLPPSDPYLQARDRDLLVPDRGQQKEVWRILGNPGVLLVDGEVAGTWRAKRVGKNRLDVTVAPFGKLSARVREAIEPEADRLAQARNTPKATLTLT
jgi:hypothetical protein